ncbi:MAG TPA: carotenoid oxygenase family protein, partial [Candidatus Nanopelagicales bacterium]|nr:carotenoid oxygenase family protein [Candidatus Nanopelagicales bacterium]
GEAWLLDPVTLETRGKIEGMRGRGKMSAHPKVDEVTGELLFFDYWDEAPYMRYGVLGPDRRLRHEVPIELPGPRLPHDMAVTEHYTILHDLPLFYDMEALAAGRHKLAFHPEVPARFGVIPRYGAAGEIRWFEASPCFIYHVVNAWEEGDEVVMVACRYQTPTDAAGRPDAARMAKMIALLQMDARVVRYRFDLRTGLTREEAIDPEHNLEFPTCNGARTGRKTRFAWLMEQTVERPHFTAVVRQDTDTGAWERWSDGPGVFYSEAAFAPREGATAEDDGYLVTFAWDEGAQRSEIQVFDAREVKRGPVARVIVPRRIPAGFHATWIGEGRIAR